MTLQLTSALALLFKSGKMASMHLDPFWDIFVVINWGSRDHDRGPFRPGYTLLKDVKHWASRSVGTRSELGLDEQRDRIRKCAEGVLDVYTRNPMKVGEFEFKLDKTRDREHFEQVVSLVRALGAMAGLLGGVSAVLRAWEVGDWARLADVCI